MEVLNSSSGIIQTNGITAPIAAVAAATTSITQKKDSGNDPKDNLW